MEGLLPKLYGGDAVEIPGARALLDDVIAARAPWAVVTSGTAPLVGGWFDVLGLSRPDVLVSAESVENGKPDPACYELGLAGLGLAGSGGGDVLVLEDSPAGIRAGKAAGCKVLGLVTTHTAEQVAAAGPDWVVRDLRSVKLVGYDAGQQQQQHHHHHHHHHHHQQEGGSSGRDRPTVSLQISDALVSSS